MQLIKYDAAKRALAEAYRVDEVKDIRDKAVAIQAYARQAKDTEMLRNATEIRLRAEKRWGELYKPPEAKAKGTKGTGDANIGRGTGGSRSKPPVNNVPSLKEMGVSKTQSVKWQKLAELSEKDFEGKIKKAKDKVDNITTSAPRHSKSEFSGETEWYTPNEYLDLARSVLETIDLDPASSDKAQKTVKAKKYFTVKDDGLKNEWFGNVWLNPPYMQPHIANFMEKMVNEVKVKNVSQAIMLTHNYTDTEWFHLGVSQCSAICFTRGRIKFYDNEGTIAAPTQGQAFFYFGNRVAAFKKIFSKIGFVVTP